jgi:hypothetical protein
MKPPTARALPRVPQAFDYMFVAKLVRAPEVDVNITYRYPHVEARKSSGSSDLFLKSALQFCFPVGVCGVLWCCGKRSWSS